MRPSWKSLFGDVELRENLQTRGDGVLQLQRRIHDLVEDPVDAEPDAELLLVRLDVDVRRAALDRVGHDQVHEFDDRRFFGTFRERLYIELFIILEDFEVGALRLLQVFHDLLQLERRSGAVVVVDRGFDSELGGHDRLDVVARHELDVVHGEHVGRIGHRDRDRRAGLVDGKDVVLARDVGVDQLDHRGIDFEVIEVDRRHTELLRKTLSNVLFGDEAELDEGLAQFRAGVLLDLQRVFELILSDQAGFSE